MGDTHHLSALIMSSAPAPGSKGRVLLAYSGGLDTSCILARLIDQGYEVIAFMADVGQEEDFKAAEEKALKVGAKKFFCVDLRREFVEHLIYPSVQANCIYEGVYLLGTSLARPVIARGMMDIVVEENCQFVSHGCTGKGNDQVRFELAFYGLQPNVKVIAPWRDPVFYERFAGRSALLNYAAEKGIPVVQTAAKPWSTDENLFHISYEAGILEDPDTTPPTDMWKLTNDLSKTPRTPERITLKFDKGLPTSLIVHPEGTEPTPLTAGKEYTDPVEIFLTLNALARKHGIGRIDIVENRFIGVQSCLEKSQETVNGRVRLALLCVNVIVEGRSSESEELYDAKQSSMDELGGFSPQETTGFIAIESIRIKKWGEARLKKGGSVKPESVYPPLRN